jgi:hypothetical protein
LDRKPSTRRYERILDGAAEAHLVALACGEPPAGHGAWTIKLLAEQMVVLGYCESIGRETVRRTLKKMR